MAIAVEVTAIGSNTGVNTVSAGPITPSGSDRHLIGFGANAAGSLSAYTDMTFGGGQMTAKVNVTNPNYVRGVAEELVAPATSAGSLTYTTTTAQDGIACAVIVLSGVDQATPTDAYQSVIPDTSDPMSIPVTIPAGDLGVAWFYCVASGITAGDTAQREAEAIGGSDSASLSTKAGPASAMTATRSGIAINDYIGIAVNLNMATVAAVGSRRKKNTIHPGRGPSRFGQRLRTRRDNTVISVNVAGTIAATEGGDSSTIEAAAVLPQGSRRGKKTIHPGMGPYNPLRFKKSARNTTIAATTPVAGEISAIESGDSSEILAAETIAGVAAATEGADSSAISAAETISGSIAASEGADSSAVAAVETIPAALEGLEGGDSSAITGAETVLGDLAAVEAGDSSAIAGTETIAGAITATETGDSSFITDDGAISGVIAATEGADSSALAGTEIIAGALASAEAGDSSALSAAETITGSVAASEGGDASVIAAIESLIASLNGVEGGDSSIILGAADGAGSIQAVEGPDGSDIAAVEALIGSIGAIEGGDSSVITDTGSAPEIVRFSRPYTETLRESHPYTQTARFVRPYDD